MLHERSCYKSGWVIRINGHVIRMVGLYESMVVVFMNGRVVRVVVLYE